MIGSHSSTASSISRPLTVSFLYSFHSAQALRGFALAKLDLKLNVSILYPHDLNFSLNYLYALMS